MRIHDRVLSLSIRPTLSDTSIDRRSVSGQYVLRIERLSPTGEAVGAIVTTRHSPTNEDFQAIYGPGRETLYPPSSLSLIGALPDELVEVEVTWSLPRPGRRRAKRIPAPQVRLLRVIEPSSDRTVAPCPVFGECGGCQLQHMRYDAQLAWKTIRLRDLLRDAGFNTSPVQPAVGCESPWHYRNHMRFSVNRDGEAGLTVRNSHRVLPLRFCPIAHPRINDALAALREEPLPRPQLLIRYGDATGQMLIQPVPNAANTQRMAALDIDIHDDAIEDMLLGQRFRIRPSSFFQTNTTQANRMAALVLAGLPSGPTVTLVDAYCGVGTFAGLLVSTAGRVIAIEESASAVRDARTNLQNYPNVEIIQAKVESVLPAISEPLHGLVIDPPRAGCQRPVLDALVARRVPRIVYVSCGPDTLARDLAYLCIERSAYNIVSVQPLDMFPQTAHIESITLLEATV